MKPLLIFLTAAGMCAAAELPSKAHPGQGGLLSAGYIYPLENRATPQCHASTLAETKTGLVAAWFAGTREKHDDVGVRVSRRVDGRWTAPVEVATGAEDEDKDYPCWNPVLFQPKAGPLMLFYKVGPTPSTWWGVLMTSTDGGKTWGNRRKLGKGPLGDLIGPVKNKPVQLADGAILCPSSTEFDGWRVHFEITRDLGKTWQVIGPINDGNRFGAIQPSLLFHRNGDLQVMCRSRQRVVTTSRSADGGKTWSLMAASPLPNPNAGTDAVTLADGRQLIVYNHTVRGTIFPANRTMLNVAVSTDGKSWKPVLTLERAPGEYSYPAVIQARDGKVHVTYTWQRKTIKHAVLDSSKLK
jgi:predicted neuraminidase|tara:strand:- start:149 stop:1213 length:1065 start_codon:yes stop_codon:yes gene_type:complete